jgi:hypothetical protein
MQNATRQVTDTLYRFASKSVIPAYCYAIFLELSRITIPAIKTEKMYPFMLKKQVVSASHPEYYDGVPRRNYRGLYLIPFRDQVVFNVNDNRPCLR